MNMTPKYIAALREHYELLCRRVNEARQNGELDTARDLSFAAWGMSTAITELQRYYMEEMRSE